MDERQGVEELEKRQEDYLECKLGAEESSRVEKHLWKEPGLPEADPFLIELQDLFIDPHLLSDTALNLL